MRKAHGRPIDAVPIKNERRGHGHRGFTLIELMLAVLLVGILLVVALPLYKGYKEKIRLSQACEDVASVSMLARDYWMNNRAFPASLADIGWAGKLDPWGHPYVYYNIEVNGKGHARKDHALNPLNTDFDIYSMGPDGVSKPQITQKDSLDDIIRASNGDYIGTAAGF